MSFINELKRRNVLRVGAAYVVAAWLVIQVVETLFPVYGLSDASIRIVITILTIGLIPTVIFAWAFELTPEGLKKEAQVDRSQSITPQTGKKLDRMIMVVLALALGYFAFDKFVLTPQRDAAMQEQKMSEVALARQEGRTEALVESYGEKSIAVLPFVNMSSDEEQEYFSDGISEELLNLLAKIPDLRVISRSSAFSFKGKDIEIPEIAERLNVAHILEGSVRKAGNQVRITAQLIDARSDTHLWSETYDRQLENIFAIQDEIAAHVVEALQITLLNEVPKTRVVSPKAYTLYLQAREASESGTAESLDQAVLLLQQAVAIDSEFAAAWADLGNAYLARLVQGLDGSPDSMSMIEAAADKALAIDPNLTLAYVLLGRAAEERDNDLAATARYVEKALAVGPADIGAINAAANLSARLDRRDDAIALAKQIVDQDPLNPVWHYNLAANFGYAGRWDDAITEFRTTLRLSPGFVSAAVRLSMMLLLDGQLQAALEAAQLENNDQRYLGLALAYHALGKDEESDAALERVKQLPGFTAAVAMIHAYRGEADWAFEWLEKASYFETAGMIEEPLFWSLRSDPRWLPFLESINRSPRQLADIQFQVSLPEKLLGQSKGTE